MIYKDSGSRIFIHYGSPKYDQRKFDPVRGIHDKPRGGLWACNINTDYGWKEICVEYEWEDKLKTSFKFSLKRGAKVLRLKDPCDFRYLPIDIRKARSEIGWLSRNVFEISKYRFIDWEVLKRDMGIDAVEYVRTPYSHDVFYTWDIDSLVVLNPDVIIEK